MQTKLQQIQDGFKTAFIDHSQNSDANYRPQFIYNNYKEGHKVISSIEQELKYCDEFFISVAFITEGGIALLLQTLKELEEKGIKGKILTTNYLNFSEPKALRKLNELSNIEVRMFCVGGDNPGFHTKGYMFRDGEIYKIIVGSSNMTGSALTVNKEWNTKIVSTMQGEYAREMRIEFEYLWDHARPLDGWIDTYTQIYEEQKRITRTATVPSIEQYKLEPNTMQVSFIESLNELIDQDEKKALLISATGTGKTYASAFALRQMKPKRALFLVHREQIAKQAKKSYQNVFGDTKTFGILSGTHKDYDADLIFSTVQTMSKDDMLSKYAPDAFDVIVVDEVHRAGASMHQKIMDYFTPKLYLGMTASPERTDGFDIFELFDHNIAYEIRLNQALEENLLCPFHYFGISELEINGETVGDDTKFSHLICDERVRHIIETAEYYGYSGNRVKGLIFCSSKAESRELSSKFNERGYRTLDLSGEDSQEAREQAIDRLVNDAKEDNLDYIFTVDIFNEGVDIPEINQVIMLRKTESPIVFVQQLGRGLRKAEGKEFVIILDFIGNYENNFMIPIALSGDRSYNKDTIRKYVMEGTRVIPGTSTVHFDEISKARIFSAIDGMQTKLKLLKEKYNLLKVRLGKIPTILDFYEYGEIDPQLFVEYARTYDNFVRKYDPEYTVNFSHVASATLEFVSSLLINGKRPHELVLIDMLLKDESLDKEQFIEELNKWGQAYNEDDYLSAIAVLSKDFINSRSERVKYAEVDFLQIGEDMKEKVARGSAFNECLADEAFYDEIQRVVTYGLKTYKDKYLIHEDDNLTLYEKYTRKDVCRILNWEKDDSSTMYGYRIKYNTCPIFVTYNKAEDISKTTLYKDEFINEQLFSWMTRSKVKIDSPETKAIIEGLDNGMKYYLFVKKSNDEGSDFYYMGKVRPVEWAETTISDGDGRLLPIMNFKMRLEHSVRKDLYEYIIS